jgi:hypothetical protein
MTTLTTSTGRIPREAVEHLQRHHVITVSTSSFTGMPHADTVVYASDSNGIFFFVGEGTQMLRNIKDSRHVSFMVDDYTVDWRKVREMQGVGRCQRVPEDHDAAAWALYVSKYGQATKRPSGIMRIILGSWGPTGQLGKKAGPE